LNTDGTCGTAPDGRGTMRELLAEDPPGAGKSCGLIRRIVPGLSDCQPPNAALPVSTGSAAAAGEAARISSANAAVARLVVVVVGIQGFGIQRLSFVVVRAGIIMAPDRNCSIGADHFAFGST
jgi:hypothetical protein